MEDQYIDTWTLEDSDTFTVGTNEIHTLDAIATASEDGSRVSVAVVNKHPEESRTTVITLDNASEYRVLTVNGPSKDSYNDMEHTDVELKAGEWMKADGNEIEVTIDAHSVNVIQIRMK
jgi:alpha-N-arabinofuranosidase